MRENRYVRLWVGEVASLTAPDRVEWIDGSEGQINALRKTACLGGELIPLNGEKLPNCFLHRSHPNDVARTEERTFICTPTREEAGNLNRWCDPAEMLAHLRPIYRGCMRGKTLYVIPFSMGSQGSPFAKIGVQLTDSVYVALSMGIMTRVGETVMDALGDSPDFVRCLHALADCDPERRYIAHFPQDRTVLSVGSGYGGNALLGKKCFALRLASYLGKQEGWLAEHMLILGVQDPQGEVRYMAAAFPSACGKTNLAMLVPPKKYRDMGYRVWTVGDDIAWLRVGKDGRLWAVNPENGFFGVAPGTSAETNPNALACTGRDTLFTNVALNTDDGTVWWEGLTPTPPPHLLDWRGRPWDPKKADKRDKAGTYAAHPNARFTAPIRNCPVLSRAFEKAEGVPLSAIVFGGRRATTVPLVRQARNWSHGVFLGSSMASETTAAATGKVGVVRRDPMAMRPFVGYDMGRYFAHWLSFGARLTHPPCIFGVNWFRTDGEGKFLWQGYGENFRVLLWMLDRCQGKVGAKESPIGYLPYLSDLDTDGLDLTGQDLRQLFSVNEGEWRREAAEIRAFYREIGTVPPELDAELSRLETDLS